MSDPDLQEGLARHRGFAIKAREVLLEPPAPFAVVAVKFLSNISFFYLLKKNKKSKNNT